MHHSTGIIVNLYLIMPGNCSIPYFLSFVEDSSQLNDYDDTKYRVVSFNDIKSHFANLTFTGILKLFIKM